MPGTSRLPASFDTAPVRPGEELDSSALTDYLQHISIAGPVQVDQFPSGHSNLTYLLRADDREYVLRRGPLGPVAPKAHDMAREFRLLRMVQAHFPEAPEALHLCEDPSVLGTVFFLMERRRGVILRDHIPPEISAIDDYAQRLSQAMVACLVRLHAIDIIETGLVSLGKPGGFLERQVQGWAERWRRAQVEELPAMDAVIRWLEQRLPTSPPATLVHNDFKLDNLMFRPGSADEIAAVLDWEMATVGDPLADLGLTLCYWTWASAPQLGSHATPTLTSQSGWYTRDEFLATYARLSGRDVSNIRYYEVLGVFKLAVILQQIYYRFRRGQTSDRRFADFGERVRALISVAGTLMEQHG